LTAIGTVHQGVLDLERVHGLLDVRRGPLDLHDVPDGDRAVREPDRRDADVAEVVENLADLLSFHPYRAWAARDKYVPGSRRNP